MTGVVTVKIIFDKNSVSVSLSLLLASFRVKDRKYLSVGFIFRISEATLVVLPSWLRLESTPIRLKICIQFHGFQVSQTELLASGFLLSAPPSSPLSNSFFISSLEVGFLPFLGSSTPAMLPVFLRSYTNALML